jgi:hypothetical protein
MRHLFIMFHPRFTTAHPMWVITVRRRYTGVTITGYAIIVIAAVAIDLAMNATVWSISAPPAASPAGMIAVPRLIPRDWQDCSIHPDPSSLLMGRPVRPPHRRGAKRIGSGKGPFGLGPPRRPREGAAGLMLG